MKVIQLVESFGKLTALTDGGEIFERVPALDVESGIEFISWKRIPGPSEAQFVTKQPPTVNYSKTA